MKEYTITKLHEHWSPGAIAGKWSRQHPEQSVTSEALYAWIYSNEGVKCGLPKLLPRAKPKRGHVHTRTSKSTIPDRVSIDRRPESINRRSELGHLEGDLMFTRGSKSANIATLVDRKSRFVMVIKNESKRSIEVIENMKQLIEHYGAGSITFDNGTEFTNHTSLTTEFSIPVYFCDPGAPWQKGSVENINKMLRRFIPFESDIASITNEKLAHIATILNNIPRKSLGFMTPAEVNEHFDQIVIRGESRVKRACPAPEGFFNDVSI